MSFSVLWFSSVMFSCCPTYFLTPLLYLRNLQLLIQCLFPNLLCKGQAYNFVIFHQMTLKIWKQVAWRRSCLHAGKARWQRCGNHEGTSNKGEHALPAAAPWEPSRHLNRGHTFYTAAQWMRQEYLGRHMSIFWWPTPWRTSQKLPWTVVV